MTNKEIIKYVMNTPHNTNPAILESMIRNLQAKEGLGGAGYDAVVKYDINWENPKLISGSYDGLVAKVKNGEWVNILIYAAEMPYNIFPAQVKHILADWDESYYVRITFKPLEDASDRFCFIQQDGAIS